MRNRNLILVTVLLLLVAACQTGCGGFITASGYYAAPLPSSDTYTQAIADIEPVEGRLIVEPIGVRVQPETKSVYVDFLFLGEIDDSLLYRIDFFSGDDSVNKLLHSETRRPFKIKHWRKAMHDSWRGLSHFSVHGYDAKIEFDHPSGARAFVAVQRYVGRLEEGVDEVVVVPEWDERPPQRWAVEVTEEPEQVSAVPVEYLVPVMTMEESGGEEAVQE
ncbi:MAG: hypothetical protein Phyf2KO_21880 [Phycisphaerales bacterium]